MAIKKREQGQSTVDVKQVEALADELADKPYGQKKEPILNTEDKESLSRTTISLPTALLERLEDLAFSNKRTGKEPRTVSAIIREALNIYMK